MKYPKIKKVEVLEDYFLKVFLIMERLRNMILSLILKMIFSHN